jgi:hypothetical protein
MAFKAITLGLSSACLSPLASARSGDIIVTRPDLEAGSVTPLPQRARGDRGPSRQLFLHTATPLAETPSLEITPPQDTSGCETSQDYISAYDREGDCEKY